jgi:release factor glutamine methyltransferase
VASVAELLTDGAEHLRSGPHSDRNRADAELLLMHVLGRNRAWVLTHAEAIPSDQLAARFIKLIERRFRGEPVQYIIGETEFYGLPFTVTPDVLIPRPETEHLVEKALELARAIERPQIVDVGTGSGAIAVALAHQLPKAEITAIDISESGLRVAHNNARQNAVDQRVRFLQGDLLAPVLGELFDLVVSNPPYVPNSDRTLMSVEVREYEPALALFAGEDGLAAYRRLIPAAYCVLVPGGFIVLETGFSQRQAIEELLRAGGFQNVGFTPDLQGIPRVASAQRCGVGS